jgi:hypothetical protein
MGVERNTRESKANSRNLYVTNDTLPFVFSSLGWGGEGTGIFPQET